MENSIINEIIQYIIKAECINTNKEIDYLFNLYKYNTNLYISDIFPRIWENDKNCFKRFTSHEGIVVNMRKISITSLYIFFHNIGKYNKNACIVISGSYQVEEDKSQDSRKLKLYRYFFRPHLSALKLKLIEINNMNAFVLTNERCSISENTIINDYKAFKAK